MREDLSQWSMEVRKAMMDKGMSQQQLSDQIGVCTTYVSMVINDKYAKENRDEIVGKINGLLGTSGSPAMPILPSEAWCEEVMLALRRNERMSVSQLAREIGYTRGQVSPVVNGRVLNRDIVAAINNKLDISTKAVPDD